MAMLIEKGMRILLQLALETDDQEATAALNQLNEQIGGVLTSIGYGNAGQLDIKRLHRTRREFVSKSHGDIFIGLAKALITQSGGFLVHSTLVSLFSAYRETVTITNYSPDDQALRKYFSQIGSSLFFTVKSRMGASFERNLMLSDLISDPNFSTIVLEEGWREILENISEDSSRIKDVWFLDVCNLFSHFNDLRRLNTLTGRLSAAKQYRAS